MTGRAHSFREQTLGRNFLRLSPSTVFLNSKPPLETLRFALNYVSTLAMKVGIVGMGWVGSSVAISILHKASPRVAGAGLASRGSSSCASTQRSFGASRAGPSRSATEMAVALPAIRARISCIRFRA
jgi:hypothetical protein